MAEMVAGAVASYTAGAAIAKHILVKLTSDVLSVAALGEEPIGTLDEASFASGDVRAVRLRGTGIIKCVASGAFSQGAVVYGRADGKIDDISTTSAIRIGIALKAATASGDIIPVLSH